MCRSPCARSDFTLARSTVVVGPKPQRGRSAQVPRFGLPVTGTPARTRRSLPVRSGARCSAHRTIQRGDFGLDVAAVQFLLASAASTAASLDGYLGARTKMGTFAVASADAPSSSPTVSSTPHGRAPRAAHRTAVVPATVSAATPADVRDASRHMVDPSRRFAHLLSARSPGWSRATSPASSRAVGARGVLQTLPVDPPVRRGGARSAIRVPPTARRRHRGRSALPPASAAAVRRRRAAWRSPPGTRARRPCGRSALYKVTKPFVADVLALAARM